MFTPARTRVYRELLRLEETGIATSAEGWIQLGQEELAMLRYDQGHGQPGATRCRAG